MSEKGSKCAVPADQIEEIITADNDVQQELPYKPTKQGAPLWPAYNPLTANSQTPTASFMLHYAYNQPVGVPWGKPDLAPLLPWIGRYSSWLEDRARLNRFRFAWLFVWKKKRESEAARRAKQSELAANPPPSGTWFLLRVPGLPYCASICGSKHSPARRLATASPMQRCSPARPDPRRLSPLVHAVARVPRSGTGKNEDGQ